MTAASMTAAGRTLTVAVVGARGRMGGLVRRLVAAAEDLEPGAAIGSGDDLAGIAGADVVVDVTTPAVSPRVIEEAVRVGVPVVVGTSGWSADRLARLASTVPVDGPGVLVVPNFSLGSVLATRFAVLAARYYDSIEIIEAHHEGKIDSPSGTAVRTAELIGTARTELGPVAAPHIDQRARGQQVSSVPVHSLRMRGVVASQEVRLGGPGEQLVLRHDTVSDEAYEQGLLLAMRRAPGVRGVVVGLDALLDLPGADAALAAPAGAVPGSAGAGAGSSAAGSGHRGSPGAGPGTESQGADRA